tara:strand:+ start:101 stop:808 length:708 start_codon:yes stop_codon:yes gene_type:complete
MHDVNKIEQNYAKQFKENNYVHVKNFITKDMAKHLYDYSLLKSEAIKTMILRGFLPFDSFLGTFYNVGKDGEAQVPDSFGMYADFAMETLLKNSTKTMEEATGLKLCPTYSYQRIYRQGQKLDRHKDRPSCEISATLCLGYDYSNAPDGYDWGMYVEKSGEEGLEGKQVCLDKGDAIIYRGCDIEHWRDEFKGSIQSQVFLHYNNINGPYSKDNRYDTRPLLGLPAQFMKQAQRN